MLLPTGVGEPRQLTDDKIPHFNAAWLPDGKSIIFTSAGDGGHRTYVMDVAPGGAPRPVTPEGTTGSLVTPDGKFLLAVDANHQRWLHPIAGGNPQKLNLTLSPEEGVFSFFGDGKSVLVRERGLPVKVYRIDLASGSRQLFKEIVPADPAGAQSVTGIRFSADGKSYAYSLGRWLSDLYVVDGLK